jgi:hypothetical protein
MTDLVGTFDIASKDGKVSGEMVRWMKGQARTASSLQSSIAAANQALQDFKDLGAWGSVLFKGETDWSWLPPGTAGQVLRTNGANADPSWVDVQALSSGTVQATTSGTNFDFALPAGVKLVTIAFDGVSLSETDSLIVQIGPTAGVETTGYVSTSTVLATGVAHLDSTAGFIMSPATGARLMRGTMTLALLDASTNTWVESHVASGSTGFSAFGGGNKALAGELRNLRLTRTGTNAFDAGAVNILYQ